MLLIYLLSGLIGVSNMMLWGIYGDLVMEKFEIKKILRSIFFGVLASIYLYLVIPNLPPFVVALVVIALERFTTEVYKALIRVENQEKYSIPSDLNIKLPNSIKKLLGVFLMLLMLLLVAKLEFNIEKIFLIPILGFLPALGGMLKDAPHEGFSLLKFFRSPIVAIMVGLFLFAFFPELNPKYFSLAVFGGERVVSEFYKKIWSSKLPGKFKKDGKHSPNKTWLKERKKLLPIYFLDLVFLFLLLFK